MTDTQHRALESTALDQLFVEARTHSRWLQKAIDDETVHRLYDLTRFGPTSANCSPARFVFVRSPEAKERLRPALDTGNVGKTMAAPLTVIVGSDQTFYEKLPELYPFADARRWFAGNDALIEETAMRNSSLQGAYLIVAARALGLDCGPMSGFEKAKVDAEFFADSTIHSIFLINIGHGDRAKLHPRAPRLEFDAACQLL